jgi:hypothetical protein
VVLGGAVVVVVGGGVVGVHNTTQPSFGGCVVVVGGGVVGGQGGVSGMPQTCSFEAGFSQITGRPTDRPVTIGVTW